MKVLILEYSGDLCPINQKFCNRRYVLSKRYRDAKGELGKQAYYKYKNNIPFTEDIHMDLHTYYPREHDIDAFVKFILDALEGIIYKNDKQIISLNITKHKSKEKGARISIIPYTPRPESGIDMNESFT